MSEQDQSLILFSTRHREYAERFIESLKTFKTDEVTLYTNNTKPFPNSNYQLNDLLKNITDQRNKIEELLQNSKDLSMVSGVISKAYDETQKALTDISNQYDEFMNNEETVFDEETNESKRIVKVPRSFITKAASMLLLVSEFLMTGILISQGNYVEGAVSLVGTLLTLSDKEKYQKVGHMMCVSGVAMSMMSIEIIEAFNVYISSQAQSLMNITQSVVSTTSNTVVDTVKAILKFSGVDENSYILEWLTKDKSPISGLIGPPSENAMTVANGVDFTLSKHIENILNARYQQTSYDTNVLRFNALMNNIIKTPKDSGMALQVNNPNDDVKYQLLKYIYDQYTRSKGTAGVGTTLKEAMFNVFNGLVRSSDKSVLISMGVLTGTVLLGPAVVGAVGAVGVAGAAGIIGTAATASAGAANTQLLMEAARYLGAAFVTANAPLLIPYLPQ